MTRDRIIDAFKRLFPNILEENVSYTYRVGSGSRTLKIYINNKYYIFNYTNDADYMLIRVPTRREWEKM